MSCAKISTLVTTCSILFLTLGLTATSWAGSLPLTGKAIIDWQAGQPTAPMIIQYSGKITDSGIEGTVNTDTDDTAFITLPVGMLDAYRRYRLTVTYRVLESPVDSGNDKARGFFAMRTQTPNQTWIPSTWIREAKGAEHTRAINYLLPEGITGYTFNIGVDHGGRLLVTAVNLVALPRLDEGVAHSTKDLPTPDFKGRAYEPFGICQHIPWKYFYKTDEQIDQAIAQFKQLGVQTARTGINWASLQPSSKDQWNQDMIQRYDLMINRLSEAQIKNHIILGTSPKWVSSGAQHSDFWRYKPTDFDALREYVRFVTRRWGKHIESYEIVNEPDLLGFWKSSIEDYMQWAKVVVQVIREEDPTAVILSGSLTDAALWGLDKSDSFAFETMLANGFGELFDGLAVHTYNPNKEMAVYHINHWYSQLVKAGLGHMPIWITETGQSAYTKHDGTIITQEEQAKTMQDTFNTLLKHPAVEKIFWYNYRDKGFLAEKNPRESGFGVVHEDFSPKPSFEIYQKYPRPSQKESDLQLIAVDRAILVKE